MDVLRVLTITVGNNLFMESQHTPNHPQKVFGIGLSKTGTSTLEAACCKYLGFSYKKTHPQVFKNVLSIHWLQALKYKIRNWRSIYHLILLEDYLIRKDFTRIQNLINHFDFFADGPYPMIYQEIDKLYPGSKFILTVRTDENAWLESFKSHCMRGMTTGIPRKHFFGYRYPHKHEKMYLKRYNEHNQEVREHFKDRPEDFIELCWENGDGWDELCSFLNLDKPQSPFPHENNRRNKLNSRFRYYLNRLLMTLAR